MHRDILETEVHPRYFETDEEGCFINPVDIDGLTTIVGANILISENRGAAHYTLGFRYYSIAKLKSSVQSLLKDVMPSVWLTSSGNTHYFIETKHYEDLHRELSAAGVNCKYIPLEPAPLSFLIPGFCHNAHCSIRGSILKECLDKAGVTYLILFESGYKMPLCDPGTDEYTDEVMELERIINEAGYAWQDNETFDDFPKACKVSFKQRFYLILENIK